MRLFGYEITRTKAQVPANLESINSRTWWPMLIREPFSGAWQRNQEQRAENILAFHAVYACVTLIASDVSKCGLDLVERDSNGIWNVISSPAFSPVLRKPNRYQNRIKFIEQWCVSKLLAGNTYALKARDARGVVVALYILDPMRTKPLVAPDGAVYYRLAVDHLAGVEDGSVAVPASEIIHDVMVPLFHPLCGVSPLMACGVAALAGLNIQNASKQLFANGAMPGGVLSAPEHISDDTAKRLKKYWEEKFTGDNVGKVAVLGDGLKFESMAINAVDAQLIEQLKWNAAVVCSCFHVPAYKVGAGDPPPYQNIEATEQQYYSQCLQKFFECIELCLDEGLGLDNVQGHSYGTQFDLDDLLRMDSKTLAETENQLKNIKTPNESRKRMNLPPKPGGDSVFRQQQDFSIEALAKRDAKDDPFASKSPVPAPPAVAADDGANISDDDAKAIAQFAAWELKSHLARLAA